jgi:DNA mismatch repair ATPase MutL
MQYFHPLHLGTAGETDWDGKELLKVYKSLVAKFPEIGKTWIQGNVHSHHSMGAFFSQTDNQQLVDGANENFYGSLVVSTKAGKEYAFAISYPDQYGQAHITHGDIVPEEFAYECEEIVAQAKYIKKMKPVGIEYSTKKTNKKQTSIFGFEKELAVEPLELTTEELNDQEIYYNAMTSLEQDEFEKFDELWMKYETGYITKQTRNTIMLRMGMDQYGSRITNHITL